MFPWLGREEGQVSLGRLGSGSPTSPCLTHYARGRVWERLAQSLHCQHCFPAGPRQPGDSPPLPPQPDPISLKLRTHPAQLPMLRRVGAGGSGPLATHLGVGEKASEQIAGSCPAQQLLGPQDTDVHSALSHQPSLGPVVPPACPPACRRGGGNTSPSLERPGCSGLKFSSCTKPPGAGTPKEGEGKGATLLLAPFTTGQEVRK